jgi:antirestriction protein
MTTTTATVKSKPAAIADGCPDVGAYFACLAAYNNGCLHGAWVDLEEITDADDLQECINWVLSTSPEPGAEEWAMHDSSGLPTCLNSTEWPPLSDLADYAEAIGEITDGDDREAFRLYCNDLGEVADVDEFRDVYEGRHDSGSEFAYSLADDSGMIPADAAWPLTCIDWEAAWRELEVSGDYSSDRARGGGVHIFRNC